MRYSFLSFYEVCLDIALTFSHSLENILVVITDFFTVQVYFFLFLWHIILHVVHMPLVPLHDQMMHITNGILASAPAC